MKASKMKSVRVLVVLSLAALLVLSGCKKKRQTSVPPQAQAPTVQQPVAKVTPPSPQPQPSPSVEPQKPTTATATPVKPKPKKKVVAKKPTEPPATTATAKPAPAPPRKIVIQSGGTSDTGGQMTARAPNEAVSHEQQSTEQLLAGTEANLRGLTRQLTADEQDMVQQIHTYMQQARDAISDGDTLRARNLALKAHLLSDELVTR